MKSRYDVIVVGGGPGGSWASKYAAENGMSVLLLEKDREIGLPVRCAEGLSEIGLRRLVDVKDQWIAHKAKGARLVAPDGTSILSLAEGLGFVLHRKIFDADLAAMASESGVEVVTKAYVDGLILEKGMVQGVTVQHLGQSHRIASSVVIGADGTESRVGRWAGLKTHLALKDIETCAQMTLTHIDFDADNVHLFFGREIAPEGYAWIFPKGPRTANVGLGISGKEAKKKKPIVYLQEFVDHEFPNASMLTTVVGSVSSAPTLKNTVTNGLILAGDAAHQANPMTGGGILCAMIAGKIAGQVAAEAIKKGDVSRKQLSVYEKRWHKAEGQRNSVVYKIKEIVNNFTDEDLNKIAHTLLEVPPEKRSVFHILKTAILKHPKLILELAKLFA